MVHSLAGAAMLTTMLMKVVLLCRLLRQLATRRCYCAFHAHLQMRVGLFFLADGVLFLFLFFSYHYIFLSDFLITGACSPLCCYPKNQIIILPLFTIAHSSLFELRPQLRRRRHHPAPTALLSYILHVYHLSHDRQCAA